MTRVHPHRLLLLAFGPSVECVSLPLMEMVLFLFHFLPLKAICLVCAVCIMAPRVLLPVTLCSVRCCSATPSLRWCSALLRSVPLRCFRFVVENTLHSLCSRLDVCFGTCRCGLIYCSTLECSSILDQRFIYSS